MAGEDLNLKVIILASGPPKDAALHWRALGEVNFKKIALTHVARGVYSARIPAGRIQTDLEYRIEATSGDGRRAIFPASAPDINQTIVIMKDK